MVSHLWLPWEYICYQYDMLSPKGRKSFVLNWEKDEFANLVNTKESRSVLDDIYATY